MVLGDCTKQTLQRVNVIREKPSLETNNTAQLAKQCEAPVAEVKKRTHNPYANVIPSEEERIMIQMQIHMAQQMAAHEAQQRMLASQASYSSYASMQPTPAFHGFIEEPAPQVETAPSSPTTSSTPSSSSKKAPLPSASLTKVYQNGRPVPTLKPKVELPVEEPSFRGNCIMTVRLRRKNEKVLIEDPMSVLKANTITALQGQHVVIDGDRGIDLGIVDAIEHAGDEALPEVKVQRLATQEEVTRYENQQRSDEQRALSYATNQASKLLSQRLTIEDATFQFDRNKLTLWYRSAERVFFVPLLKALNQQYKCRIWMERLE